MTKIELQIIALQSKKTELENQLVEINTQLENLRISYLKKNYGLKIKK